MGNIIFSENSRVNDSLYGRVQAPIKSFITKRGEQFEAESIVDKIFDVVNSTHFGEMFGSMTAMDEFKDVGENGEYPVTGYQESFAKLIEAHTWKNSFSISKEMIDDGKTIDMKKKPEAFVAAYYRGREKFGAALLGAAVKGQASTTVNGVSYDLKTADGANLFSKTHPSKIKGGNQSNLFADTFSATALAYGETAMQNFRDDNGNILDVSPNTIIIPNIAPLKKEVFEAIGSDKDPSTSNNAFNYVYGRWNVITWPYLNQFITNGTMPWIMFDSGTNDKYHGLIWLEREALSIRSDIDEDNDANIWRGRARYNAGFADWRSIAVFGVTGGDQLVPGA